MNYSTAFPHKGIVYRQNTHLQRLNYCVSTAVRKNSFHITGPFLGESTGPWMSCYALVLYLLLAWTRYWTISWIPCDFRGHTLMWLRCDELVHVSLGPWLDRSEINSLRPADAIWRFGSTLVKVMLCCLTTPSHYLNQCWLITPKVQWTVVVAGEIWGFFSKFQNDLSSLLSCMVHRDLSDFFYKRDSDAWHTYPRIGSIYHRNWNSWLSENNIHSLL